MSNNNKVISLPTPTQTITIAQTADGVALGIIEGTTIMLDRQTLAAFLLSMRMYLLTVEGTEMESFIVENAPQAMPLMAEVNGEKKTYSMHTQFGNEGIDSEGIKVFEVLKYRNNENSKD